MIEAGYLTDSVAVSEPVARLWCRLRKTGIVRLVSCRVHEGDWHPWPETFYTRKCVEADHNRGMWHEGDVDESHMILPPIEAPLAWMTVLAQAGYEVQVAPWDDKPVALLVRQRRKPTQPFLGGGFEPGPFLPLHRDADMGLRQALQSVVEQIAEVKT